MGVTVKLSGGRLGARTATESNAANHPDFSFTINGTGLQTATTVPESFAAADGSAITGVGLSWDWVSEASDYYIYRNTADTAPGTELGTTSSLTYSDTTATPGSCTTTGSGPTALPMA